VTETIGVVPFIDGGMVTDEAYPSFDERLLWAGGLGLRYYTDIGPLRLDVAFPINGREEDDFFQFYVSFGQAF
jgi:translocation and assembly module TamA